MLFYSLGEAVLDDGGQVRMLVNELLLPIPPMRQVTELDLYFVDLRLTLQRYLCEGFGEEPLLILGKYSFERCFVAIEFCR